MNRSRDWPLEKKNSILSRFFLGLKVMGSLLLILLLVGAERLNAEELKIGISFSIPPYVITENDSGLELGILQESLRVKGYTVSPQYLPLARSFAAFEEGKLDGVINVKEGMLSSGFYSDVAITFQNVGISLAKNQIICNQVSDLQELRVMAFQRASTILGEEFGRMAQANKKYYGEVAKQILQINVLLTGRVDVVVMEQNIFKYFHGLAQEKHILSEANLKEPVVVHNIFPPTEYQFAFRTKRQRDDFNTGLAAIRANGIYPNLFKKYDSQMVQSQSPNAKVP